MEAPRAFAGLGSRGLALFLDLLFVFLLIIALELMGIEPNGYARLALLLVYFVALTGSPLQGTLGKRLAGVKVTDLSGNRIGLGRSVVRFAASVASVGLAGLGLAAAAWTAKRQALHDLLAGTLVVRSGAAAGEIAGSRAPQVTWPGRIAFTGLIAAIALVVYAMGQYTQAVARRDAIRDMLAPVGAFREEVHHALAGGRPMPVAPLPPHARAFHARPDGTIVVEADGGLLENAQFLFVPTIDSAGRASWKCTVRNMERTQAPPTCRD